MSTLIIKHIELYYRYICIHTYITSVTQEIPEVKHFWPGEKNNRNPNIVKTQQKNKQRKQLFSRIPGEPFCPSQVQWLHLNDPRPYQIIKIYFTKAQHLKLGMIMKPPRASQKITWFIPDIISFGTVHEIPIISHFFFSYLFSLTYLKPPFVL